VVRALADLMNRDDAHGEVFNVGSTEEVSILDLAQRVREAAGSGSEIVFVPYDEAYEEGFEDMRRRLPDTGKLQRLLGWQPTRALSQILADVVDHERARSALDEELIHAR
jgi:UDP-glucose 4-epimerase